MFAKSALVAAVLLGAVQADVGAWGQCGGSGYTGSTVCVSGYVCTYSNAWYSQCLPGTATTAPTTAAMTSTKAATSTTQKPTSTPGSVNPTTTTKAAASTTLSGGSGPGTTLQSGYYWIRAVESPNFHKYLQTSPQYTVGTAIMADYTTAGQFNIVNGQLVELITGGNLYAIVTPATGTEQTLSVSFSTSPNTYGTFAFSGDAVTWTVSTITRPNAAAWFVCAGGQLLINLGNYLSGNAPTGCADETIHYYNGATAVS